MMNDLLEGNYGEVDEQFSIDTLIPLDEEPLDVGDALKPSSRFNPKNVSPCICYGCHSWSSQGRWQRHGKPARAGRDSAVHAYGRTLLKH